MRKNRRTRLAVDLRVHDHAFAMLRDDEAEIIANFKRNTGYELFISGYSTLPCDPEIAELEWDPKMFEPDQNI